MAFTDQSTRVRDGEELDANVIDPYLKAHIPGLTGVPQISQFPGGASNLTYLLEYPEQEFVLRRPPFGHKAKSAHDMGREFRILNQLREGFPYCPKAYVHCTDESVMGAEFYVMERVKGIILRSELPPELGFDAARTEALCKSFIDRLVELHRVDYNACGLADLGKPEGYVARQIRGWSDRYESPDARCAEVGSGQGLAQRQDAGRPPHFEHRAQRLPLRQRDPRPAEPDADHRRAGLGTDYPRRSVDGSGQQPRLLDRSRRPGPRPTDAPPAKPCPGMLTRREFVDYYAERAGIRIDNFDFYYTYGLFRLAGIVQQIYYRFFHGQTQDKRFAQFVSMNKLLEQMSLQVIGKSTL